MDHISPLLIETLFWFIQRWSSSYLLPDLELYEQLSPNLSLSFDSHQGITLLNWILQMIQHHSIQWMSDVDIVRQVSF